MPLEKRRKRKRGQGAGAEKMIVHLLQALNFNEAPITRHLHMGNCEKFRNKIDRIAPTRESGKWAAP